MAFAEVGEALRQVALFKGLTVDECNALARQVVPRQFARNEVIFSQGDPGDGLYIVSAGHVSIGRQNPEGDELILAVYERSEYFGELALFDQEPRSATAVAIDECSCFFLARRSFQAFLEQHPAAVLACLTVIVRQLRRCTDLVDEIALLDVRSRLARRLLHLADQGVVETNAAAGRYQGHALRITQQQLASMTGATRESVNKHLNAFVDARLIQLDRGRIRIIDREGLEAVSTGEA